MSKRVLIAVSLVAALAGGTAITLAQPPQGPGAFGRGRGPHDGPGGRVGPGGPLGDLGLRGIDLTDAQREQVRTIRESHQEEFQQAATKMRDAHRAFAEAVEAESVDEAAIRARSGAIAAAMADEAILRSKVRSEVFAILTAEQQEQLKTRRAEMENRRQEMDQRRRERKPPQ